MPLDSTGTYRHNHESASMHSKAAGKPMQAPEAKEDESTGDATEIHDHGDGTFHTEPGNVQHESIGHLHAHISATHGQPGHKHFHAHHDGGGGGGGSHSHSVESGGEGDHREHEDENGMREHFDEFAGEDGQEDGGQAQAEDGVEHEHQSAGLY